MFITNAGIADVFVVAARTAPDGHRGITTFIVEAGTPGLTLGQPLRKMGWHASDTREVVLADCLVPPEAVLGEPNRGFHQIMSAFQLERLTLAAMGVGHAEECLALATAYARDREVFGSPLISLQATRHRLAALSVELEAARVLTYRAAARLDSGHPETGRSVAMAKYHAAIAANRIIDECVQLFGGAGFLEETAVARHYRDARVLRIGGGTDEIQLEILAKDLRRVTAPETGAGRGGPGRHRRGPPGERRQPLAGQAPGGRPAGRPARSRAAGGRTACSPTPAPTACPPTASGPGWDGSRAGRWPSSRTTSRSRRARGAS